MKSIVTRCIREGTQYLLVNVKIGTWKAFNVDVNCKSNLLNDFWKQEKITEVFMYLPALCLQYAYLHFKISTFYIKSRHFKSSRKERSS